MSLLIKALQKAEQDKPAHERGLDNHGSAKHGSEINSGLSLETLTLETNQADDFVNLDDQSLEAQAGFATATTSKNPTVKVSQNSPIEKTQEAAAAMFTAKTSQAPSKNSKAPLMIGLLLLLLALVGGGFYYYLQMLAPPELIVAKPVPQTQEIKPVEVVPADDKIADVESSPEPTALEPAKEEPVIEAEATPAVNAVSETKKSTRLAFGDDVAMSSESIIKPSSKTKPLKVTRSEAAEGINPDLLAAYQAFNQGNDANAQQLYRKALQADVRNVDALLGMAAIASRQGRYNDALGWYGKVSEIEPRNPVAQAAMVNLMGQGDPVASESRIKSLIAQQPRAAHLQAALGNLYAEQNQWASAQQAYFEAYHLDVKNPEYAFNLAVSLDQMQKQSLALQYYKEALALLPQNGGNVDRAVLEARISALQ